jgi:hypothetical protein
LEIDPKELLENEVSGRLTLKRARTRLEKAALLVLKPLEAISKPRQATSGAIKPPDFQPQTFLFSQLNITISTPTTT